MRESYSGFSFYTAYIFYERLYLKMDTENSDGHTEQHEEAVVHPGHYNQYQGFEVIDVCEQLRAPDGSGNFNRGNAFKYLARAGWKNPSKQVEDLEKAVFYLQREIGRVKSIDEQTSSKFKEALEVLKSSTRTNIPSMFDEVEERHEKIFATLTSDVNVRWKRVVYGAEYGFYAPYMSFGRWTDKLLSQIDTMFKLHPGESIVLLRSDACFKPATQNLPRPKCPYCNQTMERFLGDTTVLVCEKHAVAAVLVRQRREDTSKAIIDRPVTEISPGAWDLVPTPPPCRNCGWGMPTCAAHTLTHYCPKGCGRFVLHTHRNNGEDVFAWRFKLNGNQS